MSPVDDRPSAAHAPGAQAPVRADDPATLLADRLLPVLLHAVNNHTQFLTGLRSVLALTGGGRILHDKAEDLARTGRDVEDAGWLLALLASGSGANLMLARREARGLRIVAHFVDEALRKAGAPRVQDAEERSWPDLAPGALDGWQLPWSLGSLLLAAGLDAAERAGGAQETDTPGAPGETDSGGDPTPFEMECTPFEEQRVRWRFPAGPRVNALAPSVDGLLPEADVADSAGHLELVHPAAWLAPLESEREEV